MKKLSPTLALLLFCLLYFAPRTMSQDPDIDTIKHKYYTSYFSKSQHIPIVIQYTLSAKMLKCAAPIKRTNKFTKDPASPEATNLQKDYTRSGYDRGHNMSAADNECDSIAMKECFYFSNMTPQPHTFNAGVWEKLEDQERTEATASGPIIVFVGSVGKAETIGADNVVVPKFMWKVIYHPTTDKYESYLFPDLAADSAQIITYVTTIDKIQEYAGIKFDKGSFSWVVE